MSVKEIDEIKEQFKKVISYSQGIENPVVDDLFEKWLEGKRDFIEAMGGKLIYEFPKKVFFCRDNICPPDSSGFPHGQTRKCG